MYYLFYYITNHLEIKAVVGEIFFGALLDIYTKRCISHCQHRILSAVGKIKVAIALCEVRLSPLSFTQPAFTIAEAIPQQGACRYAAHAVRLEAKALRRFIALRKVRLRKCRRQLCRFRYFPCQNFCHSFSPLPFLLRCNIIYYYFTIFLKLINHLYLSL